MARITYHNPREPGDVCAARWFLPLVGAAEFNSAGELVAASGPLVEQLSQATDRQLERYHWAKCRCSCSRCQGWA